MSDSDPDDRVVYEDPFGMVREHALDAIEASSDPNISSSKVIHVYSRLAVYAGGNSTAWPAVKTLASKTGLSETTVHRALSRLKKLGIIDIVPRTTETGRSRSNTYVILSMRRTLLDHGEGEGASTDTLPPMGVGADTGRVPVPTPIKRTGEREERAVGVRPSSKSSLPTASDEKNRPNPAPRKRPRNELLDAIAEACEYDVEHTTRSRWRLAQKALTEIREASPDVTPDDIHRVARRYRVLAQRGNWGTHTPSPMGISAYWGMLVNREPLSEIQQRQREILDSLNRNGGTHDRR